MNGRRRSAVVRYLSEAVNWIGYITLSAIVLVTSADVIGRYCFNTPIIGANELLELSMAVFGGFAIVHTTTRRGHISVDLFFVMFPRRLKTAIHVFGSLLGSVVWGMVAYRILALGKESVITGYSSTILNIPTGYFELVLAFALALFSLILLIQAFFLPKSTKGSKDEDGGLSI
jgi:TRAP-type C4-dicarboxylate transport system permease small subunit